MSNEKPNRQLTDEEQLAHHVSLAEQAYTEMYDSLNPTACYSNAKEFYYDAIALANKLGQSDRAAELEERLAHIKAVFRSQFS